MDISLLVGCVVVGAVVGGLGRLVLRPVVVCRVGWLELCCAGVSGVVGWLGAVGGLSSWWLPVPLVLGWFAVPLVAADLARCRLPDRLTLTSYPLLGLALAFAASAGPGPTLALRASVGALLFGGVHLLVRLVAPRALGGGDVKLAGSLGAVLGAVNWAALGLAAGIAALVTVVISVATRSRAAPHGPGLLAATWLVAVFPGDHLPAPG